MARIKVELRYNVVIGDRIYDFESEDEAMKTMEYYKRDPDEKLVRCYCQMMKRKASIT